jgi:hypothetical protein
VEHFVLEELVEIFNALFTGLEDQLGLVRIGNLGLCPWRIIEKTIHGLATTEKGDLSTKRSKN